jgi:outer membrane usher protein FimD/PapC
VKWVLMSAAVTLPLANAASAEVLVAENSAEAKAPVAITPVALPAVEHRQDQAAATDLASSSDMAAVDFDTNILKQRGLDPSVAAYFRLAPRFAAGTSSVKLTVNGEDKGKVNAVFDQNGHLCVEPELLRQAGLLVPKGLSEWISKQADAKGGDAPCYDYRSDVPQAVIQLSPPDNAVALIVPSEALDKQASAGVEHFDQGGTAALFNYDLYQTGSTSASASPYFQATTEAGFNTGDWLFRSRQVFSAENGSSQWSHSYAYGQHTWLERKAVVQGGEINLSGTSFSVGSLYGVQLFPEQALADKSGSGALVQGIAQSQARVEVRQLGSLIYSTLVPPGPFSLTDLPIKSTNADLNVTVIEAAGAKRQFTVPAGSFIGASVGAPRGFSAAIGRLTSEDSDSSSSDISQSDPRHTIKAPWVATLSDGWALGSSSNLSGGALVSSPYQALSLGLDFAPTKSSHISATLLSSHSQDGQNGSQANLALGGELAGSFSGSVSASGQTIGYRELNDVVNDTDTSGNNRSSYSASLGWNSQTLGAFSLGYSRSMTFSGNSSSHLFASWGITFKSFSASINLDHSLGGVVDGNTPRNQIYANITIPLGERSSLSSYASNSGNSQQIGAQFSQTVNDVVNYNLQTQQDASNHTTMMGGDLNLTPYYTQLGLHVNRFDANNTQYSSQLSGGVVANGSGVVFSPYAVKDTFGVAQVGSLSGVKIDTPSGPVWTDHWGRAVIPSLPEYTESNIRVETKSLPRNADINNAGAVLKPEHGAVSNVKFGVVTARRVMMHIRTPDGQPVQKGLAVLDGADKYMGTVASMGIAMLTNPPEVSNLFMKLDNDGRCKLNYTLPQASGEHYYESADAVCEPVK